jgi:hypothetical protein
MTATNRCTEKPVPVKRNLHQTKPLRGSLSQPRGLLEEKSRRIGQTNGRSRRVQFASTCTAYTSKIAPEDLIKSWYSDRDYAAIKCECRTTVAAFHANKGVLDPATFTITGLTQFLSVQCIRAREFKTQQHAQNILRQQKMLALATIKKLDHPKSAARAIHAMSPAKRARLQAVIKSALAA